MSKRGPAGHRREGQGNPMKSDTPPKPNPSRRALPGGNQGPLVSGGKHGYLKPMRREEAAQRAEARSKRSPQDQLAILDRNLGVGIGAVKERARLLAQIKAQK